MDKQIIKTILEYLDTPPYLRKKIYPKMWILKHAGTLPPIKSPHHMTSIEMNKIKDGDVRFGFAIKQNGSLYVDVGLEKLIRYKGSQLGKKVLVRIIKNPQLVAEDISKDKPSVTEKVKESVGDAVITTKIKAEFAKDKDVSALNIKVDTDDKGVVTLSGNAKSQAEADKAVTLARKVQGVKSVRSDIKVQTK